MIVEPRKIIYRSKQQRLKSSLKDINKMNSKLSNKSKFYEHSQKTVSENTDKVQTLQVKTSSNGCTKGENVCQQSYWGKIRPYLYNADDKCPRICISPSIARSLLLNLLIIITICIALPLSINKNIPLQLMLSTPKFIAKKYSVLVYSIIWSIYQFVFLMILLLGNPGYGEPQSKKTISLEEQNDLKNFSGIKRVQGYNKCSRCESIVDNSVYHCQICDICCEGFSHHCQWIGKCIGYRNVVYLHGYFYGFIIGLVVLVILRVSLFYL